ncbi:MAG: ABC transporter permease [Anaerolineaceae bacterium]|nr:ABC transporter permease [Anaerolineaceae bacterium]MBN2678406.1 ABC transporter permease [Anaerolineaceae bacterium]
MIKTLRIFWQEYKRHVIRKRFILMIVSIPALLAIVIGIALFSVFLTQDDRPVGVIDEAGYLVIQQLPGREGFSPEAQLHLVFFNDDAEAKKALDDGTIQAYYFLPADYPESGEGRLVYVKTWNTALAFQFERLLRYNMTESMPEKIATRLMDGAEFVITSLDKTRQMSEEAWGNLMIPFAAGLMIMMIIITAGNYLLQAVVEEKENRTIEIIVTSVSPNQLMAGKILGDIAVGLTQLLVWSGFLIAGFYMARGSIDWVDRVEISTEYIVLLILVVIPTFITVATLMAAVGSISTEMREAQQISGYFTIPIMAPYWFSYILMTSPNGPLAVILSFMPLTAPVTLTMRAGFTQIPTWQLAINIVELFILAFLSLWLAGKAFRMGMLNYGKRLSLTKLFSRESA